MEQSERPKAVVILDNGSSRETRCSLSRLSAQDLPIPVHVTYLGDNLGVGKGHELAWKAARHRYPECDAVWVLEHDTVADPDCLRALAAAWALDPGRIILPVQRFPFRSVRLSARIRRRIRRAHRRFSGFFGMGKEWAVLRRFTFNGVLLSWHLIDVVGFPRADFFVGLEDREYALRIMRAGFGFQYVEGARVQHIRPEHGGVPSGLRWYYSTRNQIYFDRHVLKRRAPRIRALGRFLVAILISGFAEDGAVESLRYRYRGLRAGLRDELGQYNPDAVF